jgi:hypothetical protein
MKGHEISLRRFTNLEFHYMIVQGLDIQGLDIILTLILGNTRMRI